MDEEIIKHLCENKFQFSVEWGISSSDKGIVATRLEDYLCLDGMDEIKAYFDKLQKVGG